MRWSQTLIPTLKETPADAQIASHQLMLRAGLIRQVAAGVYDLLPLGWRAMRKVADIIRQEMDALGAAEALLPAVQPAELWQRTGRDVSYGQNLMRFKDRHGRPCILGPTAEEVVTELVGAYVQSYKQLPLILYQIQTKFRDEYRPRFGLLRVREFLMKDAYSFHAEPASLDRVYQAMYAAYERIFARCGVPFLAVEAESGPMGGGDSHEFISPSSAGEDTIVRSDRGHYAANLEGARTGPRPHEFAGSPTAELERVHTPNLPGIADVAAFLGIAPRQMLKTLVFQVTAGRPGGPAWLVGVVRGDHDVNEAKLLAAARQRFGVEAIQLADNPQVRAAWAIGFVGPDAAARRRDAAMLVDPDAAQPEDWVSGANETDYHVRHFNWHRECVAALGDAGRIAAADIRNVVEGDPSPRGDGGRLTLCRGVEVGHVFRLGDRYTRALEALVRDESGQDRPMLMGCYGIGLGRVLVAAIEASHDDRGIIWPAAIAPYSVVLTPIRYDGQAREVADRLYEQLRAAGIDALLDDRDARAGFKFADADLAGFPIRINIAERGLKEGKVEVKLRRSGAVDMVTVEDAVEHARRALASL